MLCSYDSISPRSMIRLGIVAHLAGDLSAKYRRIILAEHLCCRLTEHLSARRVDDQIAPL